MKADIIEFSLHLFWNTLDFLMLYFLMKRLYGEVVRWKRVYRVAGACVIIGVAVISKPVSGYYNIVDIMVCSFLLFPFYKRNILRQVLYSTCLWVLALAMIIFFNNAQMLLSLPLEDNPMVKTLVHHLGLWSILLFLIFCIRMKPEEQIPNALLTALFMIPLMSIGVIFTNISISFLLEAEGRAGIQGQVQELLSSFFILFMNLLVFYIYDRVAGLRKAIDENLLLQQHMSLQTQHYRQARVTQQRIRGFYHDMKNQLNMLSYLLEEEKTEKAKQFLDELYEDVRQIRPVSMTGNTPIDAILNMKLHELYDAGIPVTTDITIPPDLRVSFEQAVAIFGNLLDNAKEASLLLPPKERRVSLHLKYTNRMLFITVRNVCAPAESAFAATKEDKLLHGLGLKNVLHHIEQIGGTMNIAGKEELFTVQIVLYDVSPKKNEQD